MDSTLHSHMRSFGIKSLAGIVSQRRGEQM